MQAEIPQEKKLSVICRVEGGCLGPEGEKLVVGFCGFAFDHMQESAPHYINIKVLPRMDKTLAEMDFQLMGRPLSRDQLVKYLSLFGDDPDSLEDRLNGKIIELINQYLGR